MDKELALLRKLGHEAAELSRKLDVPPERLGGCQGTDATGTVTVELNGHGLVAKVAVGADWRKTLGSFRIGPAILEAVKDANERRLAVWADAVAQNDDTDSTNPLLATPELDAGAVQEVFDLLAKVDPTGAGMTRQTTGESAGGHIRVTLTGKQISAIDISYNWLDNANQKDISRAARSAIRHAYAAARQDSDTVFANNAATKLKALLNGIDLEY